MATNGPASACSGEAAASTEVRNASLQHWKDLRYGPLPPNVYRILDSSGELGSIYQLEIGTERITLTNRAGNPVALYGDTARAVYVARDIVAERFGEEAGADARFCFVWAGDA
jgi:hypothetical protein